MTEDWRYICDRLDELSHMMADPAVISKPEQLAELMKEYGRLEPLGELAHSCEKCNATIRDADEMMLSENDTDMLSMLKAERDEAQHRLIELIAKLNDSFGNSDLDDDKNVIIEIRGGAGGEEAALFAASVYRMYNMFAAKHGWKTELLYVNDTELGGMKEVSFIVEGHGAYSRFKYESGVHRVQRVPETESGGRIHTSTVTVAVLPEVDDVKVNIAPEDISVDTFRSSGAGGQHINKTESAIRITHKPTGLVVECQDERSQHKNKDKAMKVLMSKLYDMEQHKQHDTISDKRKTQVGTGDRSERIRTYNFPQSRVTDHRIGLTVYKLGLMMDGDMDMIIDGLIKAENSKNLMECKQ